MPKLSQFKFAFLSIPLALSATIGIAQADDFTVSSPTAATFFLDGNDALTIADDGSIATTADFAHAVDSTGNDNAVFNNGSITVAGDAANGIYGSDSPNLSVINNGMITASGSDSSYGIYIKKSDNATIINNGTVTAEGDFNSVIAIEESIGASIENYGTVVTKGSFDYGLSSDYSDNSSIINYGSILAQNDFELAITMADSDGSTVVNYGTITVQGSDSYGLNLWYATNASVSNNGSILTNGGNSGAISVEFSDNVEATNTGSARATGINSYAFYSHDSSGVSLTNSGSLISERSFAIVLDDGDTVLNLSTAGYIGGGIQFLQPATVNLTTVLSNSVLWDFSDGSMIGADPASISGTMPWFYNATSKQFATYDASALAGSLDALGDMTDLLSDVSHAARDKNGFWIRGFGGAFNHNGDDTTSFDRDITQYGVALGYSDQMADGTRWRAMGGYLRSEMEIDATRMSSFNVDDNNWFVGADGARDFGPVTINIGLTAGRTHENSKRFINDNLARTNGVTLGESWAHASYGGWFLAPEIGVSTTMGNKTDGWSVTPGAHLRYANQWIDGFTESGSLASAHIDERTLGLMVASAEVALARNFSHGSVFTRLGYQSRRSTGDDAASVSIVNTTRSIGFADTNAETPYAGIGMDVELAPGVQLNLDTTGYFGNDLTGGQGTAKLTMSF